jgi:hypothetical protein
MTTELHVLRVTKGLQNLIKMGGHDEQKKKEVKNLNQKIEFLTQSSANKYDDKRAILQKHVRSMRGTVRENERLANTAKQLEAAVRERLQISQIRRQEIAEEAVAGHLRMKAILTRRKLVDLAKLQSEEIHFLRDQVETLRKRTFASFALPAVSVNPDDRVPVRATSAGMPSRSVSSLSHLRHGATSRAQKMPPRSKSTHPGTYRSGQIPALGGSGHLARGSSGRRNSADRRNSSRSKSAGLNVPGRSVSSLN